MKFIYTRISDVSFVSDVFTTDKSWKDFVTQITNALDWQSLTFNDVSACDTAHFGKHETMLPYMRQGTYIMYQPHDSEQIHIRFHDKDTNKDIIYLFQGMSEAKGSCDNNTETTICYASDFSLQIVDISEGKRPADAEYAIRAVSLDHSDSYIELFRGTKADAQEKFREIMIAAVRHEPAVCLVDTEESCGGNTATTICYTRRTKNSVNVGQVIAEWENVVKVVSSCIESGKGVCVKDLAPSATMLPLDSVLIPASSSLRFAVNPTDNEMHIIDEKTDVSYIFQIRPFLTYRRYLLCRTQ